MATKAELESVAQIFRVLFEGAARDVSQLTDLATQTNDNAIEVRPLLRAAIEGALDDEVNASLRAISQDYEHSINAMCGCAADIGALITFFVNAEYSKRLQAGRLKSPDGVSRDVLDRKLATANQLNSMILTRHSQWGAFLLNFGNLVRGIDGAQALLLNRPSKWEVTKKLAKAGAADFAGIGIPFLGTLMAFAEAQSPDLDRLIDEIGQASSVMARWNAVGRLLAHQIKLAEFTQELISDAAASEQIFSETFNVEFGAP